MNITLVAGARPNFVKLAPIIRELQRRGVPFRWIHTGQHSGAMSDPFLSELELPPPDLHLTQYGHEHAAVTAGVLMGVALDLQAHRPDWLVVLGDVNSTLGAALAAAKLGIRIAHVEAGYRSGDWAMPEEVNRVLVDRMSDLLLTPDPETHERCNWREVYERKPGAHLRCVGNVMTDSLRWALERAKWRTPTRSPIFDLARLEADGRYAVLTCHRPATVDSSEDFARVGRAVAECPYPVVWPVHPRAAWHDLPNAHRIDPLGYLDMVALLRDSSLVITDSGGVFEEALMLNKEIVSLRDPAKNERQHLLTGGVPDIWKSDAAPRIVDALLEGA